MKHSPNRRRKAQSITPTVEDQIRQATTLLASGKSMPQAAKALGLTERGLADVQRRHADLWKSSYDRAMEVTASIVRTLAGTDASRAAPDQFLRQTTAADRWSKNQGRDLLERSSAPEAKPGELGANTRLRAGLEMFHLERNVCRGYIRQIEYAITSLERFAGRELTFGELCDDLFNRWLVSYESRTVSPETVRSKRRTMLTLWRWAWDKCYDSGAAVAFPRRIRQVKVKRQITKAWTVEQAKEMLKLCGKLSGKLSSGVARSAFWRAFVLVAWHTGLRLGDLLELRRDAINADGVLAWTQHKTGWPIVHRLPPEALEAIEATYPPHRDKIFGDALSRRHVIDNFRMICDLAGVPPGVKMLRRSAATAVEMQTPGGATPFLGHLTPGLAQRHYIDHRQLMLNRPQPPSLTG